MKNVKYIGMMGLAALMFIVAVYAPQMPVRAGNDTNVDIGIIADTLNLNVTATTTEGGELHIYVNGTEVTKTTIFNTYEQNYDGAIFSLSQKIGGVQYNLFALANYTDGKMSALLVNDNYLAKWIGCINSTSTIGQRILAGNSTIVMELTRLTDNDDALLDMVIQLGITVESNKAKLSDLEAFMSTQAERISTLETELAPEFTVSNLTIEPKEVEPGEEATIRVTITNTGELPGTYKVTSVTVTNTGELPGTYNIALGIEDGITTILTKEVTLEGGQSETLEFKVSPEAGSYDVEVDGLTGSFTVKATGISPGYIAGILILIIAAGASIYALYKRGHSGPVIDKAPDLQGP